MSPEPNDVQHLLDKLRAGEASAVAALTQVTYDRLRRLAAKIVNESFPALRGVHDSDSVFNVVYLRLHTALTKMAAEAATPPTPADFFRFAAYKIRHALLDMVQADRQRRKKELGDSVLIDEDGTVEGPEPPPEKKAEWREFLTHVSALPEEERDVFQMHFFMDMTQAQIAQELGVTPKQVSRAWLKASKAVGPHVPG